jgi:hypothetical protein
MSGDRDLALKFADHAAGVRAGPADRRVTAASRSLVALGRMRPTAPWPFPRRPATSVSRRSTATTRAARRWRRAATPGVQREADAVTALGVEASRATENGNVQIASIAGKVLAGRAAMLQGEPARPRASTPRRPPAGESVPGAQELRPAALVVSGPAQHRGGLAQGRPLRRRRARSQGQPRRLAAGRAGVARAQPAEQKLGRSKASKDHLAEPAAPGAATCARSQST